ncbi:hypothetical protein LINGRAPRIM_LOCUS2696 [Linum grandiflorum]
MKAEGIASLRKLQTSENASLENPVQVSAHSGENLTYRDKSRTLIQLDTEIEIAAPRGPVPSLNTKTQQRRMWSRVTAAEESCYEPRLDELRPAQVSAKGDYPNEPPRCRVAIPGLYPAK